MSNQEKAIRFDLDQLGIEQREKDAVELVQLRAEVARLKKECDAWKKTALRDPNELSVMTWKECYEQVAVINQQHLLERDEARAEVSQLISDAAEEAAIQRLLDTARAALRDTAEKQREARAQREVRLAARIAKLEWALSQIANGYDDGVMGVYFSGPEAAELARAALAAKEEL
jgi:hypothetical protein